MRLRRWLLLLLLLLLHLLELHGFGGLGLQLLLGRSPAPQARHIVLCHAQLLLLLTAASQRASRG